LHAINNKLYTAAAFSAGLCETKDILREKREGQREGEGERQKKKN
jgi:hypothetical protein